MSYHIVRRTDEIAELLNACARADEAGTTQYQSVTFEQGVLYAVRWLTDLDEPHPMKDEVDDDADDDDADDDDGDDADGGDDDDATGDDLP